MPAHAQLIVHNGRIATLDPKRPQAGALAALGGRVLAVGDDALLALRGPQTEVIDLKGRRAIPGIVESHAHPDSYAIKLHKQHALAPAAVRSRDELLARVARIAATLAPDAWFVGYRFDDTKSGGWPTRAELDAATAGRPAFILRTDHHVGFANSAALASCGVTRGSPQPAFGHIDKDPKTGEPTGLLRESATYPFTARVAEGDTVADYAAGLERVFDELLRCGITSITNSLAGSNAIRAYQELRARDALRVRVGLLVSGREPGLVESLIATGIRSGFGDEWLKVIGVEWCPDCSTSGRTAAYYEPYGGQPALGEPRPNTGMLLYALDDLAARVTAAHAAGLQVCLDGVGDRGIDFCLDCFERALTAHPRPDHRLRVEHCCYVTPAVLERIRRLGVIDSSATGFMYDLGDAYVAGRGAEAMRHMWPHRTLIDAGVVAPGHSDAPVCGVNPFHAIYALVARRTDSGQSLDAREAITVEEALRCYTTLGAYAGREEHEKGMLREGMLADLAVLDRDVLAVPADEVRDTRVEMTVVGGEVRYRA